MDCKDFGGIALCGNFAKLQSKKPDPFDYSHTAKWVEPYSFEWRETLGDATCNCTTVEVHYAPYCGVDYFHRDTCNLMRKLNKYPGIANMYEVYLPAITHYKNAVKNDGTIKIWVQNISRKSKIKVKHIQQLDIRQAVLL